MSAGADRRLHVWLPTVRGNSGSDVFTRRLAAGLPRHGVDATLTWFDTRFELAPWLAGWGGPPRGADLVHANTWVAWAFRESGLPLVATEHQGAYGHRLRPLAGRLRRLYYRHLVTTRVARSCRVADAVTAVSASAARDLRLSLGLDRVLAIDNWIDTGFFRPSPRPRRGGPFRLLFVGTPVWAKGGDLLAPLMRALGDGFELHYTSGLKDRTLAEDLPNLHCIGVLRSDEALRAAYQAADALLFPTRAEAFGLVALEAMACGLPVIASDLPSQRDLLRGGAGLLCRPGDVADFADACRRLAEDADLSLATGRAARKRAVERYDETAVLPRYVSLYRSLVRAGAG